MRVTRGNIKDLYSCNGCRRGKLKEQGIGMDYPYQQVTVIEAIQTSIRLCDDCLKEVLDSIKALE